MICPPWCGGQRGPSGRDFRHGSRARRRSADRRTLVLAFHAHIGIDTARRILSALPVRVHAVGYHSGFRVTGVPGTLAQRLLEPGFTEQWARPSWIEHFPCRCIIKIQVIPSSRVEEWVAALCGSPFGVGSVSDHGPYLGACLHCRAHGSFGGTQDGDWQEHVADGARYATWTRATGTIVRLADESELAIGSHAQKADAWNVYVISVAYGRFHKFHSVFLGRDPGTLKSDIVSNKYAQLICSDLRFSN